MDLRNLTIDELEYLISKKYGKNWWEDHKFDPNDELIQEFMYRISQGRCGQ